MPATPALSAPSAGAPFEQTTIERRELRPATTCRSTSSSAASATATSTRSATSGAGSIFPMVPGHEIAGVVAAVGSEVSEVRGRRPRRRRLHGRLLRRVRVLPGRRGAVLRQGQRATYNGTRLRRRADHTAATASRSSSRSASSCASPTASSCDVAAPLLCAGITTYSPLKHWGVGPGKKVAVIGMGGLGHMA